MNNGYVYIASPYSHGDASVREERYDQVCKKAAHLMMQGYTVFSPIAHSHPIARFLPDSLLLHTEFWMNQDLPILMEAEKLIVLLLPWWQKSKGLKREIEFALPLDIPVETHDMDGVWYPDGCSAEEYLIRELGIQVHRCMNAIGVGPEVA